MNYKTLPPVEIAAIYNSSAYQNMFRKHEFAEMLADAKAAKMAQMMGEDDDN